MPEIELSPTARDALLDLAYQAIVDNLKHGRVPPIPPQLPELNQPAGAFVTLRCGSELRGCIGHVTAEMPLGQVVQRMAVSAAENDPRFYPLTERELDDLEIEISVLSPFEHVENAENIEVGKHGLMITKGWARGLLLPQVATEYGWDRYQFLDALCRKAGLTAGSWRHGASLQCFTALIFGKHFGRREPAQEAHAVP